jgi:hypothetical protein
MATRGQQERVDTMTRWRQIALVALVGLAGCGGLESPDLAHGSISGQVVGARIDGFAYPLGHPELATRVAADGSFRFDRLAAGATRLVIYDDTFPDGTRRAELVEVQVHGAGVARVERNGEGAPVSPSAKMAWAGAIVASVSPDGGGLVAAPRFAVEGTTLAATASPGSAVVWLGLLPAASGVYQLTVSAEGYRPATQPIDLASATTGYDVPLAIETGGSGPPGCAAAGGGCDNALQCDPASGRCVQCLADVDCAGGSCDLDEHFCEAPPPNSSVPGAVCSSCTDDSQCQGGMLNPRWCERLPGATTGYCTWAPLPDQAPPVPPASSYCPSGFQYVPADQNGAGHCVPAVSCQAYFSRFGQGCFTDEGCQAGGALAGATCYGADPVGGVLGYCTAQCRTLSSPPGTCVVPGFRCQPGLLRCLRN